MGNIGETVIPISGIFEMDEKENDTAEQINLNDLISLEIREVGKTDPVGDFSKIMGYPNYDESVIFKGIVFAFSCFLLLNSF
jgi:hypothetical protein